MFTVKNLAMVAVSGATLLVGLGDIKQASAVTITFDDLGSPFDAVEPFESQGLSFSSPGVLRLGLTSSDSSQPNALSADRLVDGEPLENSFSGSIIAQFTNNKFVTDLKFTGVNNLLNPMTVSAFNTSGKLLRTSTSADAVDIPGNQAETFDFSGLKVARFETNSDFGYAIDDVSFGKPVPEPSEILGTIAFGVLGGGLVLKRKLKKQKLVSFDKASN